MKKTAWTIAVLLLLARSLAAQTLGACRVLPPNNAWNTAIDTLPVDPNSVTLVNTIGAARGLHPDFSSTGYGIPFVTVDGSQPRVTVIFDYADESDPGPYPIPVNAPIEGGSSSSGDRHVLVVDITNCVLYELYAAYPQAGGSWKAGSGAVFDLKSNILRPTGWTSADAAGLPILPGLVRYDEVMAGEIRHALRMTVPQTRNTYAWPATHKASSLTGAQYPQMGQRLRLKASFDITPYAPEVQVILRALKKYGAIVADNGSAWYITGAPDPRWNDTNLHQLGQVLGSNFEFVDDRSQVVEANSGVVAGGALALDGVYLNGREAAAGATVPAKIILTAPAPAGGATVLLTGSNQALAMIPTQVVVPQGAVSTSFNVSTFPSAPSGDFIVYATYLGVTQAAARLVVNGTGTPPPPTPTLAGVTVSPSTAVGGTTLTGTVMLGAAAPTGGAVVALASSNGGVASVPSAVTVGAGATSATFAVTTYTQSASTSATVTATLNGTSKSATVQVTAPPSPTVALAGLSFSPNPVVGGRTANGTVTLTAAAPAGGVVVTLASSNRSVAPVSASVTVPPGAKTTTFSFATAAVKRSTKVTVTASYGGVSKSAVLTVARR